MGFNEKEIYLAAVIHREVEHQKITLKEVLNAMRLIVSLFIEKAKL